VDVEMTPSLDMMDMAKTLQGFCSADLQNLDLQNLDLENLDLENLDLKNVFNQTWYLVLFKKRKLVV
jgi:uncharacterized protein YjbI with pentapeptide repeats